MPYEGERFYYEQMRSDDEMWRMQVWQDDQQRVLGQLRIEELQMAEWQVREGMGYDALAERLAYMREQQELYERMAATGTEGYDAPDGFQNSNIELLLGASADELAEHLRDNPNLSVADYFNPRFDPVYLDTSADYFFWTERYPEVVRLRWLTPIERLYRIRALPNNMAKDIYEILLAVEAIDTANPDSFGQVAALYNKLNHPDELSDELREVFLKRGGPGEVMRTHKELQMRRAQQQEVDVDLSDDIIESKIDSVTDRVAYAGSVSRDDSSERTARHYEQAKILGFTASEATDLKKLMGHRSYPDTDHSIWLDLRSFYDEDSYIDMGLFRLSVDVVRRLNSSPKPDEAELGKYITEKYTSLFAERAGGIKTREAETEPRNRS